MENKNIVLIKHHPMNIKFDNKYYKNHCEDLDERIIIDCTSRCKKYSKDLSPFYLGPVSGPDGAIAFTMETFYQCGKVYPHHDDNGNPNNDYFNWRKEMYNKKVGELSKKDLRHPQQKYGYTQKDCLYFPWYDKETNKYEKLNYVDSRKKVYIVEYAKLVSKTTTYKMIKSLIESGKKIALVDFDGFNYYSREAMTNLYNSYLNMCKKENVKSTLSKEDYISLKTMKDVVNCPFMPVRHGFTIKALLQGDLEVINDEVIDHSNILS